MQVYDTLRAGAIHDVRVGHSVVAPNAAPAQSVPNTNTLKAKTAHVQKLNDIGADTTLTAAQKREAVAAENESYAANVPTKDFHPDYAAEHRDRLAAIAADTSLTDAQKKAATDAENADYAADENQDGVPDETQDIIHLTLNGGEKRSILRSDLLFAPAIIARRQADYPAYAQRGPDKNGVTGPNSLNSANTVNSAQAGSGQSFTEPKPADEVKSDEAKSNDVYPRIGDYLVEDFDILTDTYTQKIYDAATFARYFKASLN
jgi:hypothetical protein